MVLSLATLLADRALGLRLLTGRADVEVGWGHSSDLLDPTPFLEVDNLLLTTGTQFAPDAGRRAYHHYVARLAGVGVAALGFGTEVVRTTPEPLVAACQALDLPLVEVPYRTPFIAISRRIADAQAAQAHARDLWALDAQQALSLAALSAARITGVLAELSRRLGADVLLLNGHGELVSEQGQRHLTPADAAGVRDESRRLLQRRLRSGSALTIGDRVVMMQTLGRRDELRGVLAVALDQRPDAAMTAVITAAVALAEFAVEDAARREESALVLNSQLLALALAGQLDAVREVLDTAGRQLPGAPVRLLLTPLRPDADPAELEQALAARAARTVPALLAARWGERFVVVVAAEFAEVAAAVIEARQVPVVLSRPVGWAGLAGALRDAEAALDSAPSGARIIEPRTSALLGMLTTGPRVESLARERLAPLLAAPDAADLLRMLTTWLRHNAAWDPAARELGMHRHTLKAQVRRAGELVGLDLDAFEAKAELWALLAAAGS